MQIVNFQVSVFGVYNYLDPTSERIKLLMDSLPSFLPGTLQSIFIDPRNGKIENKPRIQMVNGNNGWRVDVNPDRIDAVYAFTGNVPIINDCKTLAENGIEYIQKTASALNVIKSNRLAINAKYAIPIKNNKFSIPFLSKLPSCFNDDTDFSEWTLTLNSKGNVNISHDEPTNEILAWSLGISSVNSSDYAIIITVDINTLQTNSTDRFKISDLNIFKIYASQRMNEFLISVKEEIR